MANSKAIAITGSDFADRGLRQDSNDRPDRLFTADEQIILYRAGGLTAAKVQEVGAKIIQLITT